MPTNKKKKGRKNRQSVARGGEARPAVQASSQEAERGRPRPAPSLQDLPPEKGSVLELHSINKEFNGMPVEYQSYDTEKEKYSVRVIGDLQQIMMVKPRACKRPDIKPLELREALVQKIPSIGDPANANALRRCTSFWIRDGQSRLHPTIHRPSK